MSASAAAEAVAELQAEVAEIRAEVAAAKAELAAELRRSSDLVAAVAAAESRAQHLTVELAESRKPALVRLIEALRRR